MRRSLETYESRSPNLITEILVYTWNLAINFLNNFEKSLIYFSDFLFLFVTLYFLHALFRIPLKNLDYFIFLKQTFFLLPKTMSSAQWQAQQIMRRHFCLTQCDVTFWPKSKLLAQIYTFSHSPNRICVY